MSGNILFLGNKLFEIPPFFQTRPGDLGKKVRACSLRFSALKSKLNCVKSAPVAARLSPLVSAPAGKQNKNLKALCHGCLVEWIDVLG